MVITNTFLLTNDYLAVGTPEGIGFWAFDGDSSWKNTEDGICTASASKTNALIKKISL